MDRKLAIRSLAAGIAGAVLTLIGAAFFGPNSAFSIESRIQTAANEALDERGLRDWRATANGQSVDLEGVAPSEAVLAEIVAAVKTAAGVSSVTTANVDIVPPARPFAWSARKEDGRIVLEGVVPSRDSLKAIQAAARKLYGANVSSVMTLASGAPAGVEWDVAVIVALEALVKLKRGSAQLSGDKLVVMGLTENEADAAAVRATLLHSRTGVPAEAEVLGPPDWIAAIENGRIVFQGKVPSGEARRVLSRAAGRTPIEDKSYIAATGGWQQRAIAALPYLLRFERGDLSVRGAHFRIAGEAPGSVISYLKEDMVRIADGFVVDYRVAEAAPPVPEIAGIDLSLSGASKAHACQSAFDLVSNANRIDFASSRAVLGRSNGPALDKLAFLVRACAEFPLEIHGYTDNRGGRKTNTDLSLARANAVRDYLVSRGLSADRLTALGFGPDRPVASNESEAGRAKNRRIEFHVVRGE